RARGTSVTPRLPRRRVPQRGFCRWTAIGWCWRASRVSWARSPGSTRSSPRPPLRRLSSSPALTSQMVAVVDLGLGSESGLDLIGPLRELEPRPRLLVLTMSASSDDARDAVRRGASGYVLKDDGPEEVLAAIRLVAGGGDGVPGGGVRLFHPAGARP